MSAVAIAWNGEQGLKYLRDEDLGTSKDKPPRSEETQAEDEGDT